MLTRGVVFPANTADAVALTTAALAFLSSLVPLSAGADLLSHSLQLTFGRRAAIFAPGLQPIEAAFTGEGMPIATQMSAGTGVTLTRAKLAVILSASYELLSMEGAESFMRSLLVEATGPAIDRVMFSAAASAADRPAGLLNGIAPMTATGGDLVDDLVQLVAAVSPLAGNGQVAIVAAPEVAAEIHLRLPKPLAYGVLASASLAAGVVIAIALPCLVSAVDGAPSIEARRDAVVHQETGPAQIINEIGTMASPVASMLQIDAVSLRLIWQISWAVRDARAVAWMTRT